MGVWVPVQGTDIDKAPIGVVAESVLTVKDGQEGGRGTPFLRTLLACESEGHCIKGGHKKFLRGKLGLLAVLGYERGNHCRIPRGCSLTLAFTDWLPPLAQYKVGLCQAARRFVGRASPYSFLATTCGNMCGIHAALYIARIK